jgi:rhamnose transport system permease protein
MNWIKSRVRPEQLREISLLILILLVVIVFGTLIPHYYSARTFDRISSSVMIITILAVGETLVILTRNIDLSIGSIVGFTAYFVGMLIAAHHDLNPIQAVLIAAAMGAVMGALNGALVVVGGIPSIIVTLGTMAIFRGILIDFSGARTITTSSLPEWLQDLPQVTLFSIGSIDIEPLVALAIVIVIVFQIGMMTLNVGRRFYAIGSNPEAANLIGLPTRTVVFSAFLISGALAGLGGFVTLARFGDITVQAGSGLELQVVAAVVVGGVNIFGGSGTVFGAMCGAVLIGTLEQSLFRLQISQFWLNAMLGLLILLAVTGDSVILGRLRQVWANRSLARNRA